MPCSDASIVNPLPFLKRFKRDYETGEINKTDETVIKERSSAVEFGDSFLRGYQPFQNLQFFVGFVYFVGFVLYNYFPLTPPAY